MTLQAPDPVSHSNNLLPLSFGAKVPGFVGANIPNFKESLNNIDDGIANLLGPRDKVSRKIGAYKKSKGMPILVPEREQVVKNDMFEYLRVKAHKVKNIGNTRTQSDRFWDVLMKYSRDIQERDTTNVDVNGLNFDALRGEIDVINRKIVDLVALRMQLFADQALIPGSGTAPLANEYNNYPELFAELDGICMAGRGAKIPLADDRLW